MHQKSYYKKTTIKAKVHGNIKIGVQWHVPKALFPSERKGHDDDDDDNDMSC